MIVNLVKEALKANPRNLHLDGLDSPRAVELLVLRLEPLYGLEDVSAVGTDGVFEALTNCTGCPFSRTKPST